MYKVLKPFKWFLRETGETIEFIGKGVSTCGKKLEDLGDDILKELEDKKYIAKHVDNTGAAEPKAEPVDNTGAAEPKAEPVDLENKKTRKRGD